MKMLSPELSPDRKKIAKCDIGEAQHDPCRGKTSTLPKKENQGAAAQDFRLVEQVQ